MRQPDIDPEFARHLGIPYVNEIEVAQHAAALQYLSDLDEDVTIWDTTLELNTDTGQVVRGRNLFKWIAFIERIDASVLNDERSSSARAHSS